MRKEWLIAAVVAAIGWPASAAATFTLEQALSAPFPSDLTASPHGDALAWVVNASGVRNIFIARAPDFAASAITKFSEDDGQELDEIAWKTDGSAVFFTRGGPANGRGEFPNPLSSAAGAKEEVWIAPLGGGAARAIGEGHSPAVAPDGSAVAWVRGGQIWWTSLTGEPRPAQLVHARGSAEDLAWSPDSRQLAFTSNRGDHEFIGICEVRGGNLRFLDASVDRDQTPVWSPDGRGVAFIRLPAARDAAMHEPKRTGDPWSIRVVDVKTGAGRETWRAQPGMGSVFWPMTAAHQLLWCADERIVFPWEGDGWLHLYSVAADATDGRASLLTPGNFEIEHVAATPDGRTLVYSSNQDDADRRHLWQVGVAGGVPRLLTPGSGIEWSPAPLAGGAIALLHSDAKMPARPAVLGGGGTIRDLAPTGIPPNFPASSMVEPQPVMLTAADGMRIHAQLFLPPDAASGAHPAVVFFHGGSRREMLLGWHYMFYYHQAYGFNQYLASCGYVVLSVNYRSGTGYGEEFREALGYGPNGASEYNDVKAAGLYLRGRSDVDPARVGVWGGSYGGYLTALALARDSDLFAAGVDLHGVHDWNLEISNSIPAYEPEKRLEVAKLAYASSPMASIAKWRSPVLLIQGDDDRNVEFSQSVRLAEALRKQGVTFEQLIFPDEVHDFLVQAHWLAAYQAADGFFERYLKHDAPNSK